MKLHANTLRTVLALVLFSGGVACGQYKTGFEPPTFLGAPLGLPVAGSGGWVFPLGTVDFDVYTWPNPHFVFSTYAATQCVGGTGPGMVLAAIDHSISLGSGQWTIWYDFAVDPEMTSGLESNDIGSFALEPQVSTTGYTHLLTWPLLFGWPFTAGGYQAFYVPYNFAGVAAPWPGVSPGPAWSGLARFNWYRSRTRIDLVTNMFVDLSITDLLSGSSATAAPAGWYLAGGMFGGPPPTALRLSAGGSLPNNTAGWDNLCICAGPGLGDTNCDGVVNFFDIDPFILALVNPAGYDADFPNCCVQNADCNLNGSVGFEDIDPFVVLLVG